MLILKHTDEQFAIVFSVLDKTNMLAHRAKRFCLHATLLKLQKKLLSFSSPLKSRWRKVHFIGSQGETRPKNPPTV